MISSCRRSSWSRTASCRPPAADPPDRIGSFRFPSDASIPVRGSCQCRSTMILPPQLRGAAAPRDPGRGHVRRLQPRPLCDRRLLLSDRAAGRRRAARPRRRGRGDRHRPGGGGADPAARRRHLAMRPDRGARAGDRLQQVSGPSGRDRCRSAPRPGRAGGRSRPVEPPAATAQAVLSGRSVDREPCHDRRHDREQQLRCALAALRHHGAQCARHRRGAGGRHGRPLRRGSRQLPSGCGRRRRARALSRAGAARCAPSTGARPTRSPAAFRSCCVGSAATTSTASTRPATTWRTCWSARKARSPFSTRSSSNCSRCPGIGCSASAISRASTRRWPRPRRSSHWVRARSNWSTAR